ncbi:uncharacterized protein LOC113351940 [Papaver somniferum]|uniref:uncharacterized protein LOC113351940 n=1 Tax=Papaver somniferum TaxID=3469 RepID=UPI000E6F7AEF|nr:uncharacterized protein LOC113351940 [Papaver somniferum]
MNNYSWAAGVLAFVLGEMSKGSRIKTTQIGGYLTLIQVWIYDHFPKLGLARKTPNYPYNEPTAGKWVFLDAQKKSKEEQLASLREQLDDLTVNDMVFHPYTVPDDVPVDEDDLNGYSSVSAYYGPIWHPHGYTIYNPRRILDNFLYNLPLGDLVSCGEDVNAYEEDYMEFYQEISHPIVIHRQQQAIADKAKAKEREAKRAQKEMPICGEEAIKLWDNLVKKGTKLLKKWMTRIRSGESMSPKEQTLYHSQWEQLISQRMVEASRSKQMKRGRQQGEGSSREAITTVEETGGGDETPTNEEVPFKTRGEKVNKRPRRTGRK